MDLNPTAWVQRSRKNLVSEKESKILSWRKKIGSPVAEKLRGTGRHSGVHDNEAHGKCDAQMLSQLYPAPKSYFYATAPCSRAMSTPEHLEQ